jgi:nucleoside-diphosphate-sugar epimerase
MSDTILITGGTGAMGTVLVKKLSELGHGLRVLTLPGDKNAEKLRKEFGVDVRYGSVADAAACRGLCDGVSTVLHLAAVIITNDESLYTSVNAGGTRNIVAQAVAAGGVKHFIHVSSASVQYPKPTPYSISKRLAEDMVRKSPLSWTIVRPTLVYGRTGGQEFDMFLSYLKRFPVVPFIGAGGALKRPVFVDDVVDGLVKLAVLKTGRNAVYNLSGPAAVSILDFSRLCLTLMGKTRRFIHLPVWLCIALAAVMKRIMSDPPLKWSVIAGITQDADLDPSDAIRDFGYAPRGFEKMLLECFPRQ